MTGLIKALATVMLAILLLQSASAQIVPALKITVESNEGVLNITNAVVVADYLSEENQLGEHVLKLKNNGGDTLYQLLFLSEGFGFPPQGFENSDINIVDYMEQKRENFSSAYFLPFLEEAEFVSIEGSEGEIARFNLGQLCNSDNSCQATENYISCPEDCPLNEKDNYCLPLKDEICDPDCIEGIDLDCTEPKPTITPEPSLGQGQDETSLLLTVIAVTIIVVLVLIFFKMKK